MLELIKTLSGYSGCCLNLYKGNARVFLRKDVGSTSLKNNLLNKNVKTIKKLQEDGGQIIITTSWPEEFHKHLEKLLDSVGINPYAILMGMNHAARVVINDFAPTNPYPSGIAITLPRNANLKEYF